MTRGLASLSLLRKHYLVPLAWMMHYKVRYPRYPFLVTASYRMLRLKVRTALCDRGPLGLERCHRNYDDTWGISWRAKTKAVASTSEVLFK